MGEIDSTREGDRHIGDLQRDALLAERRSAYNAAADCWAGWSVSDTVPDALTLERGFELAQRSLALTEQLELGNVKRATGMWLCGAFELALGRRADAYATFALARDVYRAGDAPGLVLLAEGYMAIAHGAHSNLAQVCARLADGGFEDGAAWIEQLRTAAQVFMPARD